MPGKKNKPKARLEVVEAVLVWEDLEPILLEYVDQTIEFVTDKTFSAQISGVDIVKENFM